MAKQSGKCKDILPMGHRGEDRLFDPVPVAQRPLLVTARAEATVLQENWPIEAIRC